MTVALLNIHPAKSFIFDDISVILHSAERNIGEKMFNKL